MNENDAVQRLEQKGIKPTSNRILVLEMLERSSHPVCLLDLENMIETMDKSSIFRVLTLFLEHDMAHAIEDGSGSLKYEVCTSNGKCTCSDRHVHFYCESCHQTFCFKTMHIPEIELPEGFTSHSANYVIKGECPKCKKKHENI